MIDYSRYMEFTYFNSVVEFEDVHFNYKGTDYSVDGNFAVMDDNIVEVNLSKVFKIYDNDGSWVETAIGDKKLNELEESLELKKSLEELEW